MLYHHLLPTPASHGDRVPAPIGTPKQLMGGADSPQEPLTGLGQFYYSPSLLSLRPGKIADREGVDYRGGVYGEAIGGEDKSPEFTSPEDQFDEMG